VNIQAPFSGAPAARQRAIRPDAREAFLRGRFFWAKRGQANAVIASKYLSTAIELQRDYAEAWAALADVYAVNAAAPSPVIEPWPGNPTDAGIVAAREAMRLAPELGEPHAALGKLLISKLQFADAERSLREAVRLSPQYSTARQWLGTFLGRQRRCDEARTQVDIGARLDPLTALVNEAVGSVHLQCGEPERAIEILNAVLQMHPTATTTRIQLGRALVLAGRPKEALAVLRPLHQPDDAESFTTAILIKSLADAGELEELQNRIARLRAPYLRAVAAAAIGDRAGLYENLQRALDEADRSWLTGLVTEPAFAPYVGDARFAEVAARVGFPVPIPAARFASRFTH